MPNDRDRNADVVKAMGTVRSQEDRWVLADTLLEAVPTDSSKQSTMFKRIRRLAAEQGVSAYTESSLRQYRDTAAHWPKAKRIPGVSFTAHRKALGAEDPEALLKGLAAAQGAGAVTVGMVAEARRIEEGGVVAGSAATTPQNLKDYRPHELLVELWTRREELKQKALAQRAVESSIKYVEDMLAELKAAEQAVAKTATLGATPTRKTKAVKTKTAERKSTRKAGDLRGL